MPNNPAPQSITAQIDHEWSQPAVGPRPTSSRTSNPTDHSLPRQSTVAGHRRPKREGNSPASRIRQGPNEGYDCDYQQLQQVIDHYERLLAEQERGVETQPASSAANDRLPPQLKRLLRRVIDRR